jgi:hypothetical protein
MNCIANGIYVMIFLRFVETTSAPSQLRFFSALGAAQSRPKPRKPLGLQNARVLELHNPGDFVRGRGVPGQNSLRGGCRRFEEGHLHSHSDAHFLVFDLRNHPHEHNETRSKF